MNRTTRALATSISLFLSFGAVGCASAPKPQAKKSDTASAPEAKHDAVVSPEAAPAPKSIDPELAKLIKSTVLHFGFNGAELTDESRTRLQRVAQALKQNESIAIQISGNCDERGTEEYNMALGQERAEAARAYLSKLGIDGARVRTISDGEGMPVAPRQTEDAYSANRRDDITIADQK